MEALSSFCEFFVFEVAGMNEAAWKDLRNKAAHGLYVEYTKEQVTFMLLSVRDCALRYPA